MPARKGASALKHRIFVVCTNPEAGQYIAFDSTDPQKQVTARSKESAIAQFVTAYCTDILEFYEQSAEIAAL